MSYVKYEGLGTPDGVLQKIRDYVHDEGYTIVEDMMDDLDIFDRNYNDGKRLVFKDKTGNYFINMRSMNGYQIFPEMAGGTVNPAANTLPTTASQKYVGIGATISEGYSKTQRWYDQYLAPKKFNSDYVVGTGVRVAGETPSWKKLPATFIGTTTKNYGDITVDNVAYKDVTFPYWFTANAIPLTATGGEVSYRAEKDTFNFSLDVHYDFSFFTNSFVQSVAGDVNSMIADGKIIFAQYYEYYLYYPVSILDSSNVKLGEFAGGMVVRVLKDDRPGFTLTFFIGSMNGYAGSTYLMPSKTKLSDYLVSNPSFKKDIVDVSVSNLSSYGTLPVTADHIQFSITSSQMVKYVEASSPTVIHGTGVFLRYYYNGTTGSTLQDIASIVIPDLIANNVYKQVMAYSNQSQTQTFLNPTTLYCNHVTTPTDTLTFTLVDKHSGCYQHMVIGNINKYATWDGGIFMSGSHNSYSLSKHVYDNSTFNDILPVLSTTELGATTFARINIDEAPQRSNIYWASSGKPDVSDPYQCYTGKQLAMPIRHGEGITGTWRPMIPHYGYMQSRSATDPGINSNTLNCITINLPLYMAVKVDPDSLNNFAPIGEVSGVYLVSLFNMASASVYEISYPTSGNLHQVFSLSKRRDKWGFDGISIKQEDNTPTP